jgi:hypothetical protein
MGMKESKMNKIYVKFMSDAAIETVKLNIGKAIEYIHNNPMNANWIKKIYDGPAFIEKKYRIPDFNLLLSQSKDYKEVDFDNSIMLYESLKDLPRHILTDERFWAWINFEKAYHQALQSMPIRDKISTLKDHYFFSQGNRRGLFFGVLSRCYFRVELSVDESLEDKYELTRFVIDNPERIRNLTWRSFSNQKHIVLGVLKAEKRAFELYNEEMPNSIYKEIAKYVSKIGSVRLLDVISEDYISESVFDYIVKSLGKPNEGMS